MMIIPVILAGGSGTRLWPLSRELYPKQLLPLVDERSLLQNTILRLEGERDVRDAVIVCNEHHRFLVAEQFRAVGVKHSAIILEPAGRNTAPAVAVAALHALTVEADSILLVLPADHHLEKIEPFLEAVRAAADFARRGFLVTFGITAKTPETGYGYIERGEKCGESDSGMEAYGIRRFVEKPDAPTARTYVDSGDYYWNSGMFMFRASDILEELTAFAPEIVDACRASLAAGVADLDFLRLGKEAFMGCPSDSIDYAVMEKTRKGCIIPLDAGWSDLGSWSALQDVGCEDACGNISRGDVVLHDVANSYIHSESRLVAAVGLEGHIVVETSDAVLVASRDRVQDVKLIVQKLRASGREETLTHRRVARPWGWYECINVDARFQVKRITVKPGAKLSYQKHYHRSEHWIVVRGTALVTRDREPFLLKENESTYIPMGVDHRLENPGKIMLELIEVQLGSYLGEDDIVRYDDDYGRE